MGPLTIHICAVQFVHKRGTHITRLAQGPARLKKSRIAFHLCAPEKNLSSGVAHVSPFCCCSLTCPLPRALHLPHSLFLLRHKNTQHNRYNMINSEKHPVHHPHLQAPSVDKLRHLESLWREDLQSDGNPRTTTLQTKLEKKITKLRSPKKWRNLERLGQLVYQILKYRRRPTSNRRCMSTIPWKALQILISKMESYKRC